VKIPFLDDCAITAGIREASELDPARSDRIWTLLGSRSASVLGLGSGAARVGRVDMARKLNRVGILQTENLLETLANLHQNLLTLLRAATLTASSVAISATWEGLASRLGPQADTVKALAHINDDPHDFAVILVLERLADGGQHDVQPQVVDVGQLLVAEGVGPFATVLVVDIFPFGADTCFEEVVVGFLGELVGWCDVVLDTVSENSEAKKAAKDIRRCPRTPPLSRTR
jgi:hypothetical protein